MPSKCCGKKAMPKLSVFCSIDQANQCQVVYEATTTPQPRPHMAFLDQARTITPQSLTSPPRVYVPMLMRPWSPCTHMALWHLFQPGCCSDTQCLRARIGGLAWTFPPAGGSAAASSAIRARLCAKQFVGSRSLCHYQRATVFSSASTISGPYPSRLGGNVYILIFTDRFSHRADIFATSEAELTASGMADILVGR